MGTDSEARWEGNEQGSHKAAVIVVPQHPQKSGIRTPGVQKGSVSSRVLLTILLRVLNAALMLWRCFCFIVC